MLLPETYRIKRDESHTRKYEIIFLDESLKQDPHRMTILTDNPRYMYNRRNWSFEQWEMEAQAELLEMMNLDI